MDSLRSIRLPSGHTLSTWDAGIGHNGKSMLKYEFTAPPREGGYPDTIIVQDVLFRGEDFGCSPMHAIDSDSALLALLGFLSLRPGDTDSDYFAEYTPAQVSWTQSSECESLACDVSIAESEGKGECVCAALGWVNLDGHECPDAPTVADFQVIDHGEDGSQYFPGCGTHGTPFEYVETGVGDTGKEALEDALEMMAQNDATVSPLQEYMMREHWLTSPNDKSAHESIHTPEELADESFDHDGCDWNHYVSVRYNVRKED